MKQLKEVPDRSVRLVLTEPPCLAPEAGTEASGAPERFETEESFTTELLEQHVKEWYRVLVPGGTLVCWMDRFKLGRLMSMCERAKFGGRFRTIYWFNDDGTGLDECGTALVVSKPPTKDIIFNNKDENGKAIAHRGLFTAKLPLGEGTQPPKKPVSLLVELIRLHSNPGDTVLDSFADSGSMAVACAFAGRRFIGVELDPDHYADSKGWLVGLKAEDFAGCEKLELEFEPRI